MNTKSNKSRVCTLLRGGSSESVGPGALGLGTVFAIAGIVTSQAALFSLIMFAFNVFATVFNFGKPQPDPALAIMSYSILSVVSLFLTGIFYLGASKLLKNRWWIKIRFWCLFASVLTAFTGVLAIVAMAYVLSRWSSYIARRFRRSSKASRQIFGMYFSISFRTLLIPPA